MINLYIDDLGFELV